MLHTLLQQVPDPRTKKGRRYPLSAILGLVIVTFLCGRHGLAAACRLGKDLTLEQRRRLGFRRDVPCHSTITETFAAIDPDALAAIFGQAMLRDGATLGQHLSLDGKTMRGSKDQQGRTTHCVAAFCDALRQVVGHTASVGKGMEIPDALALLEQLDLTDKVITADALLTQKEVVATIVRKGGDYVLPVKDNQKALKEAIKTAFETPVFPPKHARRPAG